MTKDPNTLKDDEMDGYEKIDQYNPKLIENISAGYRSIISDLGEDPNRDSRLITAASLVLAECLRLAPELHNAFYAKP